MRMQTGAEMMSISAPVAFMRSSLWDAALAGQARLTANNMWPSPRGQGLMKSARAGCRHWTAYRPYRERCASSVQYGGATRARVSGGACCRGAFAANDMGPAAGQMPMKVCGRQTAAGKPPARSAASLRARESSRTAVQDGRATWLRMSSGPACAGNRRRGGRAVSPRCALSGARSR